MLMEITMVILRMSLHMAQRFIQTKLLDTMVRNSTEWCHQLILKVAICYQILFRGTVNMIVLITNPMLRHQHAILTIGIVLHWIRVGIILHKYITPKDHIKIGMYINHVALFMQSKHHLQLQLVFRFINKSDIKHMVVPIIITRMGAHPQ